MTDLKISTLVFTRRALLLIAFCLFIDGLLIGAFAASGMTGSSPLFLLFFAGMLLPYFIFYKHIKRNIREER